MYTGNCMIIILKKLLLKKIRYIPLKFIQWSLLFLCWFSINLHSTSLKAEVSESTEVETEGETSTKEEGNEASSSGFLKKDEYLELNSSIEQLAAKVKSKRENLVKLLIDKEKAKESAEFKEIVKQIESEYREINEINENIEKKKSILKHRFPERSFVKSVDKSKFQKIEEIGLDAILDKKIEQILNIVESQYHIPVRKKSQKSVLQRTPASTSPSTKGEGLEQNPEDFSQSLILKK